MQYQPDQTVPTDLKARQSMADQNFAPRADASIVWRSGVGLPASYVLSLPTLPKGVTNA